MKRDGRVEDRWLGLYPREFELLWRLAAQPGKCMTCRQLYPGIPDAALGPEEYGVVALI